MSVSDDHVSVRYVLDQAEIPTVQERGLRRAEVLRRKQDEVERRLVLTVDGRRVALRARRRAEAQLPAGAGGLKTTRVELSLRAAVDDPRRVELHDGTFPGRIGWKAVVSAPGQGTAVRTRRADAGTPRTACAAIPRTSYQPARPTRRHASGSSPATARWSRRQGPDRRRAESRAESDGFAGLFADAASGQGVLLLLLLAAFGWGALHALSPGHGKAMVAAYLVGTRGRARHAVGARSDGHGHSHDRRVRARAS